MQPGMTVGPYRILEQVGLGGMATVFKAYDPGTDRYVAIKIVSPQFAQHPEFRERFRREAKSIAKLEHPRIIPVHAFGEQGETAYLVLRYMDTGTLRDLMNHHPMDFDEAGGLIGQIAGALDYAHRNGVIHRDVKPSNVLVDAEGNAYLTDFGIAKVLEATVELTGTGTAMGTPQYMSPEQCRGDKDLMPATDIYSLGVILYQMLTGHLPFDADTPLAVIHMHLNDPLPPPRQINPRIREELERVLLKALAKDPKDRYATAAEFAAAVREALRKPRPQEPAPVEVGTSTTVEEQLPAPLVAGKLRRYWWAGALLLTGLVGGLVFAIPRLLPLEAEQPQVAEAPTEEIGTPPEEVESVGGIACMGASPGDEIALISAWPEEEEDQFVTVIQPLLDTCGLVLRPESGGDPDGIVSRLHGAEPPDVAIWPFGEFHVPHTSLLTPLTSVEAHPENYADYWIELGSAGSESSSGKDWYAVPLRSILKSMIWYSPKTFESFGYEVPGDFGELEALVERMAADGNTPWAMGFESGGTSGWAGSDFIQDLLLMTGGSQYVNLIISGRTPYHNQGVVSAYENYLRWAGNDRYTVDGAEGTLNTSFFDALYQVIEDPSQAMMVYQASWVGDFLRNDRPDLAFGDDFDFFGFPGGGAIQGASEWLTLVNATPASAALVAYLTSAEGAQNLADSGFGLSPNLQAAGAYKDPYLARLGDMLLEAGGFTPDLGDTIGGEFAPAEWQAIVDVLHGADLQQALQAASDAQARTLSGQ